MRISLRFIGRTPEDLRWFIRADDRHAGGITVHSVCPPCFSYGIAVSPALRRQGIAAGAVPLLLNEMKSRGFTLCRVSVAPDNLPSLALHRALGFREKGQGGGLVSFETDL